MEKRITSHGIDFIRSGSCRQCGACDCRSCPHHCKEGGKHWCAVHATRHLYCDECGTDHASCADFPDNPWITVVRNGVCGFRFRRADGGSMDGLPFLDGEPYVR